MKFVSNDVIGVFEYDFSYNDGWSEKVKNYYNEGDVLDVDFDVVIETYFMSDFLGGKFTAVDDEAILWAKSVREFAECEAVEEFA